MYCINFYVKCFNKVIVEKKDRGLMTCMQNVREIN